MIEPDCESLQAPALTDHPTTISGSCGKELQISLRPLITGLLIPRHVPGTHYVTVCVDGMRRGYFRN